MPKKSELESKITQQAIGRYLVDPEFEKLFTQNPDAAITEVAKAVTRKKLSNDAIKEVKKEVTIVISPLPYFDKEDIKKLVDQIIKRVNEGFEQILWMSKILFYLGIGIIVTALILDVYGVVYGKDIWVFVGSSGVFGGIGILLIYQSTHKLMDRVKNSVGDIVQVKVAFFGFLDQLSVLMEHKSEKDINSAIKIVKAINEATENTMEIIQKYCET